MCNQFQIELDKEKEKNKELENADLTTVYMNGFYDGEQKWKDKIKAEIEGYKKYDNGINYECEISVLENVLKQN